MDTQVARSECTEGTYIYYLGVFRSVDEYE